ncbi:tripartite motif-containing protein 54-like isoform X3 [Bos javanicus]|uniref:tripartite motif-containing protein 54-like isoform X3 n=1 Tax=Bos javanicus TaxID=9906 RepID=UPI002AA6ECCB|nr:tripartite motif-containing protein 54-like isoform X3 [Bos javanicus]
MKPRLKIQVTMFKFTHLSSLEVIYLRGRGTNGLQRNILAENILEKFKEELETLHTKEQNQLAQTCEKHGESVNLMCLSDEEPICGMCKLFGDHKTHPVAKISDAYAERKVNFAKDIQLVLQKSESAAQAVQDMEKLIRELSTSATDTLAMIDAIGDSLLSGIKCRIATLKKQLQNEHCSKLEKLQLVARELEAPRELYQQMKMLLQHHANTVQFLHEHKRLKEEMKRLVEGSVSPAVPTKDTISIRRYFQELIRGIDITAFAPPETDQVPASMAGLQEAWQAGCAMQGRLSQQVLEDILCKAVLGSGPKPNQEAKLPRNPSHAYSVQGSEIGSRESTV